jgi:hypothetical protein
MKAARDRFKANQSERLCEKTEVIEGKSKIKNLMEKLQVILWKLT